MFKKSLAAVAVLGAFAASSFAADVTLYGKVDMGLQYQNVETTNFKGVESNADGFKLNSGVGQASRIGVKGTEDLGNGYKVSFVLENGLNVDDGTFKGAEEDRLFDREASLTVSSEWGTLMAGRFGAFSTAASKTDILMSRVESFDGGHTGAELAMIDRVDNAIAYLSPKFAGFQAAAIYSLKMDNSKAGAEGHSDADRYAGVALTYDIGALQTAIGYEQILRGEGSDNNDAKVITFGGNYDFDMFKLYAAGQYFDGLTDVVDYGDAAEDISGLKGFEKYGLYNDGIEGYGLHFGAKFDALAGHWDAGIYYINAEANVVNGTYSGKPMTGTIDGEYYGGAVRYIYNLSSRTNIRSTLAYNTKEWDGVDNYDKWSRDTYTAKVSLTHNF